MPGKNKAIASMVLGIVAVVFGFIGIFTAGLFALVGVVLWYRWSCISFFIEERRYDRRYADSRFCTFTSWTYLWRYSICFMSRMRWMCKLWRTIYSTCIHVLITYKIKYTVSGIYTDTVFI